MFRSSSQLPNEREKVATRENMEAARSFSLLHLPDEMMAIVLEHLPLMELARARLVRGELCMLDIA